MSLDEIGDMTSPTQSKLLRVLQERFLQRIGGREPIAIDVRIIAAIPS
jgi:transcriptional regulator with PAS, ATPase and Fis domain